MKRSIDELVEAQKQVLFYYSPYNFIRDIDPKIQFDILVRKRIVNFHDNDANRFMYQATYNEIEFTFLYQYLQWDTGFFKRKCFKLFTVLYTRFDAHALRDAIISFRDHLLESENAYIFIDIPSEDILLIQCLGMAEFKNVETRLHYFKDKIAEFNEERYDVRKATTRDITTIREVAKGNRNEYDRIHADFDFTNEMGDDYLAAYAESAVNGYCDAVLVPAQDGLPIDAFLALSHVDEETALLNCKLTRVVLTAVGPTNKGWHKKLVSETIYCAKELGASYVLMTTQSTNRAVFRTAEKLGFRLGATSHIFSYSKQSL